MLRAASPVALLVTLALALAGCSGDARPPTDTPDAAAPAGMTIVGLVQNETFAPIAGAEAKVRLTDRVATTDAGGLFRFEGLPLGPYVVDVTAPGFLDATLTAEPRENASLNFILDRVPGSLVETELVHFTGILRCALEAVIISPSCDTALEYAGAPSVSDDIASFEQGVRRGWNTTVVDVVFDASRHPGLAGLRLTVRGLDDADRLNEYEQFAQFHGATSFTARLDPGTEYEGSTSGALPGNLTYLGLDVYPHSHGWHAACEPVTGQCPLGVGTGVDVVFDLYVTVFYGAPAPDGYSFLAAEP